MSKRKHVYILLEFRVGDTTVVDVYANKNDAEIRIQRIKDLHRELGLDRRGVTYGIIKKTIRGVLNG